MGRFKWLPWLVYLEIGRNIAKSNESKEILTAQEWQLTACHEIKFDEL